MSKAIGMIEFKTTSTGVTAADAMVKTSEVEIVEAQTVCPGKYIAIITGDLSAVKAAVDTAVTTMLFPHFSDEHPQILNCISVLFDAMYEKDTGYELTVFGQFYHFFGLVFSNHYFIENPTRTRRDYKRILQLKQVLEFIEKNYANPITLQELSASVSMSPKYFCRFFSEMTHQTPVDYLNRQRIEEACLQLAATDDSITEIAYRNGFNDLSYFIRTFKKYKGMTPGKYKRR